MSVSKADLNLTTHTLGNLVHLQRQGKAGRRVVISSDSVVWSPGREPEERVEVLRVVRVPSSRYFGVRFKGNVPGSRRRAGR